MKYWEIIADALTRDGWSWGYTTHIDHHGKTVFCVDAHRHEKRHIVHSDELLTAFGELQAQTRRVLE